MNAKVSVFVIGIESIIYLWLYNLHDCTLLSKSMDWFLYDNDLRHEMVKNFRQAKVIHIC